MMRRRSLLTRAMLANIAMGTVASVSLATMFVVLARSAFHQQALIRAQELTQFVASQCEYPLLVGDRSAVDLVARNALKGEDVLYVQIVDAHGGATVELRRDGEVRIPPGSVTTPAERVVSAGASGALEIARAVEAPKTGGMFEWQEDRSARSEMGAVRMGYSMRKQEVLFRRVTGYAAALTLLLLAIAAPLQFWDMRRLLSPLQELAAFTRKIGSGDLSERARVVRPDEVGELTEAFNGMIDHLRTTTVSRNYVDDILQSMGESLIVVGMEGKIQTVNRATLDLLGYSAGELCGKPAAVVSTGEGAGGESVMSVYRAKSGSEIPVLFSSSALRTLGESQGEIWLAQDVTEKKRAQEELIVAKEAAEQASRAKSAFLAAMSHELRTPLNAVLGFSQLIQQELADRGIQDWDGDLEKVQLAGNHLLVLIQDILDLSKIDAGRMSLQMEDFDPSTVVEEVAGTAEPLAAKNGNRIHLDVKRAIAHGDRVRFQQCLFNLVGNACKFTHGGDVRIEAGPETDDRTNWYSVRVIDTGIGILPEEMGKLFVDFSQLDASTTRKYGGTGLGLAISRRLSRMMGGEIEVESEPGRGSTFTLRIPGSPRALQEAESQAGDLAPAIGD